MLRALAPLLAHQTEKDAGANQQHLETNLQQRLGPVRRVRPDVITRFVRIRRPRRVRFLVVEMGQVDLWHWSRPPWRA